MLFSYQRFSGENGFINDNNKIVNSEDLTQVMPLMWTMTVYVKSLLIQIDLLFRVVILKPEYSSHRNLSLRCNSLFDQLDYIQGGRGGTQGLPNLLCEMLFTIY